MLFQIHLILLQRGSGCIIATATQNAMQTEKNGRDAILMTNSSPGWKDRYLVAQLALVSWRLSLRFSF